MTHIYLVRHGQDEDNAAGILNGHRNMPLTSLGREQAALTGEKLKDNHIEHIYSSPLLRAHETARIIADIIGLHEVITDEDLIERDFGIMTGKPIVDIPKYTDKLLVTEKVTYFLEVEGAEEFPTLLVRATRFLDRIVTQHPNQQIAIVCHGDIGKMIRAAYHGWTWEEGLKTPYFANTEVLELRPDHDIIEK